MSSSAGVVVFTGTLRDQTRKAAQVEAEKHGFKVGGSGSSITKATTLLVCGDDVGAAKLSSARSRGIAVLTEHEWRAKLAEMGSTGANNKEEDGGCDQEMEEDVKPQAKASRKRAAKTDAKEKEMAPAKRAKKTGVVVGDTPGVVAFTGTLQTLSRKQATTQAEANGYRVAATVTAATKILVYGESAGKKLEEAKKKGITVYSEAEWTVRMGGDAAPEPATSTEDSGADISCAAPMVEPKKNDVVVFTGVTNDVVVFTGALTTQTRKEAQTHAEAHGYTVGSTISKVTTILVCGAKAGKKADDAKKKGITILTEEEWTQRLTTEEKAQPVNMVQPLSSALPEATPESASASVSVSASVSASRYDAATGAVNGVAPNVLIEDGTFVDVSSASSDRKYVVKRLGSVYSCSCPAWRNQRHPPDRRTCKHLKELLGEPFEAVRAQASAAAPRAVSSTSTRNAKSSAPNVLLAQKWERDRQNPVGWWISEKLDGVRAFWDAKKQVFLSRLGNVYPAPAWFTDNFPEDMDLDGELFGGRGRFQFTVGIVKTKDSVEWKQLVYKVFDVPTLASQPFETRIERGRQIVSDTNSTYMTWVEQTKCTSINQLDAELETMIAAGAEGLMLRQPESKYAHGRSSSLLKIKRFYDGEARVIAHEPGNGKYKGMCGALRCKMASGKMFKVSSGLSDAQRAKPPAIDTLIVYKCQELTLDGIPRFPIFLGIAIDKSEPTDPIVGNQAVEDAIEAEAE